MKAILYLSLGILQGITEPIPVSSSGHILLLQTILKRMHQSLRVDFETLATITNFGSLIAIIILYRKEIIELFKSFFTYFSKKDKKEKNNYLYVWKLVLGTIPAGLFGLFATKFHLLDFLENNIKFIGFTLIITAIFLYVIKDFKGKKGRSDITFYDAFIIGLYQMVSVIPGISRSGATIVGGMFRDLKRKEAFNFSFLLYIPISIATSILGVKDLLHLSLGMGDILLYLVSMIMSFFFTYFATKWFKRIVQEGKLIYFSLYCFVLGVLVILFL